MTQPQHLDIAVPYQTIALVDLNYLFTRNYRGAGIGAPANYAAERTIEELKAIASDVDHMIVCLDAPPYKRRDKFEPYKAQREERPPEERGQYKGVIAEIKRLGYRGARSEGYEADDCIATLVTAYEGWCPDIRIVTNDKDAAQLISHNVTQFVPAAGKIEAERRDREGCKKKFGVYPEHMAFWQSLVGDPSDNIPGVKGIGKELATKVVNSLLAMGLPVNSDGLAGYLSSGPHSGLAMWQAIAAQWNNLALFLDLVTLNRNVPLDTDDLLRKQPATPRQHAPSPVGSAPEEFDFVGNGTPPPDPKFLELDHGEPPPKRMTAEDIDAALLTVDDVISRPKPIIGADPNAGQFLQDFSERQVRARKADVAAYEQQTEERRHERQELDERVKAARERLARDASPVGRQMLDIAERGRQREQQERDSCTVQHEPANEVEGKADLPKAETPPPQSYAQRIETRRREATFGPLREAAAMLSIEKYGATTADLQPLDLRGAWTVSNWIAKSELYKNFDTPEKVFAVILRGREMGIDTGTALAGFHLIEGKPTASADLIRMLAERDPNCEYFYCEHSDSQSATWVTKHKKHPKERRVTYTIEDARKVPSYWKKDRWGNEGNWVIRPEQMLKKTCSSILAREVYAAATMGFYCPEEMGNGVIDAIGVAA